MENVYRLERRILGETPRNRSISYDASGRDCFLLNISECIVLAKRLELCNTNRNEPHLRYVIDGPPVDKNYSPP
jgi:hypothetical protein